MCDIISTHGILLFVRSPILKKIAKTTLAPLIQVNLHRITLANLTEIKMQFALASTLKIEKINKW